jgi:DNA polymerase III sliding clamp (beta) subunit (PCNA family)
VLREMIERTLFSVCNDETRFHLNGVFFESDGSKSRMVSTEGHRLSKVERTIANGPNGRITAQFCRGWPVRGRPRSVREHAA